MSSRYYVRVLRLDGGSRYSSFFDSLEEADRWRQTLRQDPLVRAAVIVEVDVASDGRPREPPDNTGR